MKNLYQTLIHHEGDYEEILEKLQLIHIFEPVIKHYDVGTARAIIKYILYLYTTDSDLILGKETLNRKKERCAKAANVPESVWTNVVFLRDVEAEDPVPAMIRGCAMAYLAYQEEPRMRDFKSLEDLYDELVVQAAKQPKTDGDYEHKFKCRKQANEVKEWIEAAQKKMKDEDVNIKAMKQELKEKSKSNLHSIRPENASDLYNKPTGT